MRSDEFRVGVGGGASLIDESRSPSIYHKHNWFAGADEPLLAAELQYYRAPRDDWELMLARLRQMGANTVSTYVMWGWHEPQEGRFDFNGTSHPERDLVRFVQLVQELGFRLLVKPGPFIDAEVLGGGIPSWLLDRHPEIAALRYDGAPWYHSDSAQPRCSYLHPTYLEYVGRWYAAVSEVLLPFQWPDGPIIALQVDNETPGDGMISGDVEEPGFDLRFRGDYNPYVQETLWPRWLGQRYGDVAALNDAYGLRVMCFEDVPLRASWTEPTTPGELRTWMDVARFTDWVLSEALRVYTQMLYEQGWSVPTFQDLLAMPWEAGGLLVDLSGFAKACGWLAHNVYAENVRKPFVEYGWYRLSFEEYVHYAFWRTRLTKSYAPHLPAFIPEISAVGDFFFQAPFVGGLEAVCVYVGLQSPSEPPRVGAFPRWAMEAPIRSDGSVRWRFWNAKSILTLLTAGGHDLTASVQPAEVALGYTHIPEAAGQWAFGFDVADGDTGWLEQMADLIYGWNSGERSQRVAQALVRQQVDFAVLDVDTAALEQLHCYRLLILPACAALARATQTRLAEWLWEGGQIVWADGNLPAYDEKLGPCAVFAQAAQESGRLEQVPALDMDWVKVITNAGPRPCYAWSGSPEVDVTVRHGPNGLTFLAIANRGAAAFEGPVHYWDAHGWEQSVHVRAGGPHVSFVLVRDGLLESALLHGNDGAFVVCPQGSATIDRGQVVVARFGETVFVSAPESARVTLRQTQGWADVHVWRLLLKGGIVPATATTDGETLVLEYLAEAGARRTEAYLLAPANTEVAPELRPYLTTRLLQRALYLDHPFLRELAELKTQSGTRTTASEIAAALDALVPIARELREVAAGPFSIEEYGTALASAARALTEPGEVLIDALRRVRAALAANAVSVSEPGIERDLTRALNLLARAELRPE